MYRKFDTPPPSVMKDPKHMCIPRCAMFRCSKNALVMKQEYSRGRKIRLAYCRWVGDKCVGWSCQYSFCQRRALLPDGKCGLALQTIASRSKSDMLEELKEMEMESKSLKDKFGRKIRRHMEFEEF